LAIRQGSHLTLVPNPRDFGKFIETLKTRPFHLMPGVNTLFNALLQHPMFKTIDFSHLCLTQAGGMAASEGTARAWQAATGSAMIEGWGMSETCAIGTNNPVTQTSFSAALVCHCQASTWPSKMNRATAWRKANLVKFAFAAPT